MTPPAGQPASLALLITESPMADIRGAVARRLIRSAVRAGHRLQPVLFYEDAAYTLLPSPCRDRWLRLADATGITLVVCPAAAERRGLAVDGDDQQRFVFRGLTAWLGEALEADRLVSF